MIKKLLNLLLVTAIVFIAGCTQYRISDETIFGSGQSHQQYDGEYNSTDEEKGINTHTSTNDVKKQKKSEWSERDKQAYSQGVRHILEDVKGKMHGSEAFIFEPGIIECGITVPGRALNGMVIPRHEQCLLVRPGSYELRNPINVRQLRD